MAQPTTAPFPQKKFSYTYGCCFCCNNDPACSDAFCVCCDAAWCSCCLQSRLQMAAERQLENHFDCAYCCMLCCGDCIVSFFTGCPEVVSAIMLFSQSNTLRSKYGIEQDVCTDACCAFCCPCYMMVQMHRELVEHGLDPGVTCCGADAARNPAYAKYAQGKQARQQQAQPGYAPQQPVVGQPVQAIPVQGGATKTAPVVE